MVEFLRKFEIRGIRIDLVNSIIISKFINLQLFTLILYGVGGPLWIQIQIQIQMRFIKKWNLHRT